MAHDNFNFLEMFGDTTQNKVNIFFIKEKILTFIIDKKYNS